MEISQCRLSAILRKFRPATWATLSLTGLILLLFTAKPLNSGYKYLQKLDLPPPQPLLLQCVYILAMIVGGALLLMLLCLWIFMLCVSGIPDVIEEEVIIPNSDDPETGFSLRTTSIRKCTSADDVELWVANSVICFYLGISLLLYCDEPASCPKLGLTIKEEAVVLCVLLLVVAVFNTCAFGVVWFAKYLPFACVGDWVDDGGGSEDSVDTIRTPLLVARTDEEDRSQVAADAQV